jgi:selenide,water dikinase
MAEINREVLDFKLTEGYSAETSGGLFIMVPAKNAHAYVSELKDKYNQQSWIIGEVIEGDK